MLPLSSPTALFGIPPELWLYASFVALFAFWRAGQLFREGLFHYREWQSVADTAPEPIRAVAVGRTELEGEIRPWKTTLEQPFRDGDCVWARWKIERRSSDDDNQVWETVAGGSGGVRFVVADETGEIEIHNVNDASIDGDVWHVVSGEFRFWKALTHPLTPSEWYTEPPRGVKKFLAGHVDGPWQEPESLPTGEFRFLQSVLEPGNTIYVRGAAVPKETPEGGATGSDRLKIVRDEENDDFRLERTTEEAKRTYERRQTRRFFRRAALIGLPSLAVLSLTLVVFFIPI